MVGIAPRWTLGVVDKMMEEIRLTFGPVLSMHFLTCEKFHFLSEDGECPPSHLGSSSSEPRLVTM